MLHVSHMIGFLWRGSVGVYFFSRKFCTLNVQLLDKVCRNVKQSGGKTETHRSDLMQLSGPANEAFPQHHPATLFRSTHTRKHAHTEGFNNY